jgi:cell division initiation protein
MKLTALDIHHKEFRHSLRGYSEEEVDGFLDQVADEVDRLFKENIDLSEKLEQANERVRSYQMMESTLNNTLVSAQRSAEEIVNKAGLEADGMLRDAELKAKEIVHNALSKKQTVANELIRIKQAEERFRDGYRAVLEAQLRGIDEVKLPDDVSVLLDDSDGLIGSVDVRSSATQMVAPLYPSTPPRTTIQYTAPQAAVAAVSPIFDYTADPVEVAGTAQSNTQPAVAVATAATATGLLAQPTEEMGLIDPPASGFVSGVALGEIEHPEMPEGPVELIEPGEFEMPSFDMLGERELDTDIEEID